MAHSKKCACDKQRLCVSCESCGPCITKGLEDLEKEKKKEDVVATAKVEEKKVAVVEEKKKPAVVVEEKKPEVAAGRPSCSMCAQTIEKANVKCGGCLKVFHSACVGDTSATAYPRYVDAADSETVLACSSKCANKIVDE